MRAKMIIAKTKMLITTECNSDDFPPNLLKYFII